MIHSDHSEIGISAQRIAAGWYQNQTGQAGVTASASEQTGGLVFSLAQTSTTLILYDIN